MYIYPGARPPHQIPSPYPPLFVDDCDGARYQMDHDGRFDCWSQPLDYDLLCTCRQVYREAFPLLWSTNTFCFERSPSMSLAFQKWLPHQKALIKNIRLDINGLVVDDEWKTHIKKTNLPSLQGLKQMHIVTYTFPTPDDYMVKMQRRKSRLVKSFFKLLARRPSLTIFVIRDRRLYRRLVSSSSLGNLLERV